MEALSDGALQAKTGEFRQRLANGEDLDDILIEAFAVVREAGKRVLGQRHYDVQLIGGAALHFGWIAEMKTGEGKTLVSTLPAYLNGLTGQGVPPHHGQRVPGPAGLGVDGPPAPVARRVGGAHRPRRRRHRVQAGPVRRRHHLRHEQRVRLRLPARQHGDEPRAPGPARPPLLHRRRGGLDPDRRGPDAAHHLGPGRRRGAALLQVRQHRPRPASGRGLRGRRAQAHRLADRGGDREGRAGARHRQPLRRRGPEPRPPAPGRPAGQGAVQARQGLHHRRRRGEDRRRVHRPHPRGPALVRGPPPGRRGQGGREDQGGEPDPRHRHPPELLPHVREARGDDGYGPHRGRRVRLHLRPPGGAGPHQPEQRPPRPGRSHLQDRGRQVRAPSSTTSPSATRRASPSSSARSRWRSPRSCPACSTSEASPTRCSTPSSTRARRRSSPRPAASAPSPCRPTWPDEGSTSCWAATPRDWPCATCGPRASTSTPPRAKRCWPSSSRSTRPTPRPRVSRSGPSVGCTSSAPSATSHAASTTSCEAAPAARATRARAGSTCPSRTTSCACSPPVRSTG